MPAVKSEAGYKKQQTRGTSMAYLATAFSLTVLTLAPPNYTLRYKAETDFKAKGQLG